MDPTAHVLHDLTPDQAVAVTSDGAPLCVLASAGSGKTRVLTRRVAFRVMRGDADAAHVLVLTFTRKAAGELRHRIAGLGVGGPVAAGTFHSVALAQLRAFWSQTGRAAPTILASSDRVIRRVAGSAPAAAIAREIGWAKSRLVGPDGYAAAASQAGRRSPVSASVVATVYGDYEQAKRRRGLIDLDDLVIECAVALDHYPAFREAQRWRWRHFFVDEYQDLNPSCERLLQAWLGDRSDLCVVGDPQQAIYEWNGSDPSLLDRFTDRYPSATVVSLNQNFRSTPQIVSVANALLEGRARGVADPAGPEGKVPLVRDFATDEAEALAVARHCRDAHIPGSSWSRIAVLARTNARLAGVAAALDAAGIPYHHRGGRPLSRIESVASLLGAIPQHRPARAARTDIRLELDVVTPPVAAELRALLLAIDEYLDLDRDGTVAAFREWLDAGDRMHHGTESHDAVVLSTFHRAKGLEWPVVWIVGLEHGIVPLSRSLAGRDEERRLLYVALTRARTELVCSWARSNGAGGHYSASPFIEVVRRAAMSAGGPTDDAATRQDTVRRIRSLRDDLVSGRLGA